MDFPTLFPTGTTMLSQPHIHEVDMHKYVLHLIRYHDNKFGQHPRFLYYIYNLIMCHRSNATTSVFVKKNLKDTLPFAVLELVNQLQDMPNEKIGERVTSFGSSLHGTCSYWNKSRVELTNMINQQGTPMFFFTLSASDTKLSDLHALCMLDVLPVYLKTINGRVITSYQIHILHHNTCTIDSKHSFKRCFKKVLI